MNSMKRFFWNDQLLWLSKEFLRRSWLERQRLKLEWYLKKLKKKILKNPDEAPENHLDPIPRSSLCQRRDCWDLFGQTSSWEPTCFIEFSISWGFGFYWFRWRSGWRVAWILSLYDLSEEEEEDSSFIEDEEREGSISATDLFAEIDDFDDIITDDSDDYDDDGYQPQVSDNGVRFPPFTQEARYGFSLQDRPKTPRRRL